jgi:tetratricopeptide (TPR) repeat protein
MAAFSPDGKLLALGDDAPGTVRLVDINTGAEVARLTAPVKSRLRPHCFTRDQSKLLTFGLESVAIHVFDLCAIRSQLAPLGLDWSEEPVGDAPVSIPPPARLDLEAGDSGMSKAEKRRYWQIQAGVSEFLVAFNPLDFAAVLRRGDARVHLGDYRRAVEDFELVLPFLPATGRRYFTEAPARELNDQAWLLAQDQPRTDQLADALRFARVAVELAPARWSHRNTLGVVLYRLGKYEEARANFEQSLHDSEGEAAAFNLFFLSMCQARLGRSAEAGTYYDRAHRWFETERADNRLPEAWIKELTQFDSEAATVLTPE